MPGPWSETETISCWNGATSTVRWVTCGEHAPILITADGELELLGDVLPSLGKRGMPINPTVHERRLADGERLVMLSDAVLDRPTVNGTTLGLDGIREAVAKAPLASAAGTLRAIEDASAKRSRPTVRRRHTHRPRPQPRLTDVSSNA